MTSSASQPRFRQLFNDGRIKPERRVLAVMPQALTGELADGQADAGLHPATQRLRHHFTQRAVRTGLNGPGSAIGRNRRARDGPGPDQEKPTVKLLLSNDDGVHAPGLRSFMPA